MSNVQTIRNFGMSTVPAFQILKIKDLSDKVIPLFQSIPLQGVKSKDFADFCKAVDIMKVKGHLTNEGLDQLNKLKMGMNRGRI